MRTPRRLPLTLSRPPRLLRLRWLHRTTGPSLLVLAAALAAPLAAAACGDDSASSKSDGGNAGHDGAALLDAHPGQDATPGTDAGLQTDAGPRTDASDANDAGTPPSNCGAISTFADGLTPSSEMHVATNGSDASGDGSQGNPYATLEHAARLATPGTAVVIHAGTYSGGQYISDLRGSPTAPIWIGGAAGEAPPVLSGGGEALHLSNVSYLILHDLEVSGSSDNGINCDDGGDFANPLATHHVIFQGLYLHDVGGTGNQDCLKLSGLNDYFVLDSEITACGGGGSGSGIDQVGCHHGLIARNYFHDLSANAVQSKGGSEDIEIRWNRIVDAGERGLNMGGSTGLQWFRPPVADMAAPFEARNIRAIANVFEGSVTPLAFVGCQNCLAANNTIIDPTHWLLRILQETTSLGSYDFAPTAGCIFENNLVYFDRSALATYVNIGPNTAPATYTFSHNLWYAHDDPSASEPTLPVQETAGIYGQDPGLLTGYAIDGTSPAAGTGAPVPGLVGDINGHCYGDPPSIGAFAVTP